MGKASQKTPSARKSQSDRRHETQAAVLAAATKLFGEKGYASTSLQDIADTCGMTIRPVYHYFGNKEALFLAVTESLEQALAEDIQHSLATAGEKTVSSGWQAFLEHAADPVFRQVVLVDSPAVLGRERWYDSVVVSQARSLLLANKPGLSEYQAALLARMAIAALAEAALMTVESGHPEAFSADVGKTLDQFLSFLL